MENLKTVCAIVVTFNRKVLLCRCLTNILKQSYRVSQLIVVDNNSYDSSQEFVQTKLEEVILSSNIKFSWKRLDNNLGGAGGFHAGVEEFIQSSNCDYVWLMDDDGYPNPCCLEKLLKYSDNNSYIGPLVLSDKDKKSLAFPIRLPSSLKTIDNLKDLKDNQKELLRVVLPFNGTLISREIVTRIGSPDPKYFIWGDEVDYTERAKKSGANISTICDAFYYHPKSENLGAPMFFNLLRYNHPSSSLKLYCYCRNNFINKRKYSGFLSAILFSAKTLWFYTITYPSLSDLKVSLKAFWHGIHKDLSHHKDYL